MKNVYNMPRQPATIPTAPVAPVVPMAPTVPTVPTVPSVKFNYIEFLKNNIVVIVIALCVVLLFVAFFMLIKKINEQNAYFETQIQNLTNTINQTNETLNNLHFGSIKEHAISTPTFSLPKEHFKVKRPKPVDIESGTESSQESVHTEKTTDVEINTESNN